MFSKSSMFTIHFLDSSVEIVRIKTGMTRARNFRLAGKTHSSAICTLVVYLRVLSQFTSLKFKSFSINMMLLSSSAGSRSFS